MNISRIFVVLFTLGAMFFPIAASASFDQNLSFGARGSAVIELQQFLISQGRLSADSATGYFGSLTLAAVKAFQTHHGITPISGFFGPLSRAKVKAIVGDTTLVSTVPHQNHDSSAQIAGLLAQIKELQTQLAHAASTNHSGASAHNDVPTAAHLPSPSNTVGVESYSTDSSLNSREVLGAIVIAPSGSDSNTCTLASPCKTLERAQQAVRVSPVKTVYLRAGVFDRTQMLTLTSADNGETWSTYPGDPMNSAILDLSGMTFSSPSRTTVILIQGGNNITINGLHIRNFSGGGIIVHGGIAYYEAGPEGYSAYDATGSARNNVISNNIIHDGSIVTYQSSYPWGPYFPGIGTAGDSQNTRINNNVVYNLTNTGISIMVLEMGPPDGTNGTTVENNVVYNVNTSAKDTGGIYFNDRYNNDTGIAVTGITVKNNFIRDYGTLSNSSKAIYLDDGMSNVEVTGNIITGNGSFPIQYHQGSNNRVSRNVIDLGSSGRMQIMLYQVEGHARPATGNTFTDNIIVSSYTGNGVAGYRDDGDADPVVKNNVYWNYAGGQTRSDSDGAFSDSNPIRQNPNLSGWTYSGAPGIVENWGPPGYQIPQTGTPPSSPH